MELMVVIAIFMTTFTLLLAGFRATRPNDLVRTAATAFAADVQSIVNAALTGDPNRPDATVFGILLDTTTEDTRDQYTLFADQLRCTESEGTGTTCVPANIPLDGSPLPESVITRVVEFSDHVMLDSFEPIGDRMSIVALYPRADVQFVPTNDIEARVIIRTDLGSATKTVRINRVSGRVEVE